MSIHRPEEAVPAAPIPQGAGAGPAAPREWSPPGAIVVIHGVGDHQEDATARELARALGRTLNPRLGWTQPTYVTHRGAIQIVTRDEPDVPTFTFGGLG